MGEQHQLEQVVHRTVRRWARHANRPTPIGLPIIIDA
jgi:hypothetical protein